MNNTNEEQNREQGGSQQGGSLNESHTRIPDSGPDSKI